MPDTEVHDVEEEEKVFHLFQHSANLAFAFGVIITPPTSAHFQESAGVW
jgi:hypothetical protein